MALQTVQLRMSRLQSHIRNSLPCLVPPGTHGRHTRTQHQQTNQCGAQCDQRNTETTNMPTTCMGYRPHRRLRPLSLPCPSATANPVNNWLSAPLKRNYTMNKAQPTNTATHNKAVQPNLSSKHITGAHHRLTKRLNNLASLQTSPPSAESCRK